MSAARHVLIGLPAYNEEVALPRLLARVESLRKSSPEPITVVLYNDGSTDATLATARAWQERGRRRGSPRGCRDLRGGRVSAGAAPCAGCPPTAGGARAAEAPA